MIEDPADPEMDRVTLTADDIPAIEAVIKKHKPEMLIIDPIAVFGGKLNLNQSSQMREITNPLKRLAEKYNLAIILIRHNRKSDEGTAAIYKGSGSIDGTGAVRSELAFIKVEKDEHQVLPNPALTTNKLVIKQKDSHFAFVHVKHNLSAEGPGVAYSIRNGDDGGKMYIDGMSEKTPKDVLPDKKKHPVDAWLEELLKNGPVLKTTVDKEAEKRAFGTYKVASARERLGVISQRVGFQGPHWYGYPDQIDALVQSQTVAKELSSPEWAPQDLTDVPMPIGGKRLLFKTSNEVLALFEGPAASIMLDAYEVIVRMTYTGWAVDLVPVAPVAEKGKL
jgi:AAA domain